MNKVLMSDDKEISRQEALNATLEMPSHCKMSMTEAEASVDRFRARHWLRFDRDQESIHLAPRFLQVSLGISAETPIGLTADVYVTKNGEDLDYSQNHFINDVNTFSTRTDHTSRNVIVDLKKGDTIGIHAVDSSDAVTSNVPFCISSLQI